MNFKKYFFVFTLFTLFLSCSKKDYSQYIYGDNPYKDDLIHLFQLMETFNDYSENRFTVISEIISTLLNDENSNSNLHLFVTTYINENPDDPYNSYYLLSLASSYMNQGKNEFALPYLHKSVTMFKDLEIRGESTHFKALQLLIQLSDNRQQKVEYYKTLIRKHSDRLEKHELFPGGVGEAYYHLGKTLEECERWEESIEAYENFLSYDGVQINESSESRESIQRKVDFYKSDKSWVVEDLNQLVANIKYALNIRNSNLLERYRAFDFFIINWKSNYSDLVSSFPIESSVIASMGLKSARDLDSMSTDSEAYLAVTGSPWTNNIWYVYPTWYFYFKKVDYPMDPDIHGGWEWAGIYLGEKL